MSASVSAHKGPAVARRRKKLAPYLLISSAILILIVGMGYPLIWQFVTSFQGYGLAQQFGQPAEFVGFANYIEFLSNPTTLSVVARSIAFCFVTASVTIVIGLLLAILMMKVGRIARLSLQIGLLLAWATPVVASMTVWIWLFNRRSGIINYLLNLIPGVQMNQFDWLAHPLTFFLVAMIIIIWMSVPFVAFSIYAGLTQVSDEVLEAAQLDGASSSQRLRFILIPMIRPIIMLVLLLNLVWDLRVFTQIKMLQDAGGQTTSFDLLGTYIYRLGVGSQDFSMAAAVSVFVLVFTLVLSWPYIHSLLKEDEQ